MRCACALSATRDLLSGLGGPLHQTPLVARARDAPFLPRLSQDPLRLAANPGPPFCASPRSWSSGSALPVESLHVVPCSARSQSPVLPTAPHACLRKHARSLPEQTLLRPSRVICPLQGHASQHPVSLFRHCCILLTALGCAFQPSGSLGT